MQSLSNSGTLLFNDLTIDKAGGDLTLKSTVEIDGVLTLIKGDIILDTNSLEMGPNASIAGSASALSYIQADSTGVMRKVWDTTGSFTYPIGDLNYYSPYVLTINAASFASGAHVDVRVTNTVHPNLNNPVNYINRYWTVTSAKITNLDSDVSYFYVDADIVGTEIAMTATKWLGSWSAMNIVNAATNNLTGTGLTKFGDFTSADGIAPLPIDLLSFDAIFSGEQVDLSWATAFEYNNDYFTIERSIDGVDFELLTHVAGTGNNGQTLYYTATDRDPYYGVSYYRLKQTDYDGTSETFPMVAVQYQPENEIKIEVYPNPAQREFSVDITGQEGEELRVVVLDMMGQQHFEQSVTLQYDGYTIVFGSSQKLASGVYMVMGSNGDKHYSKKLVIR